MPTDMDPGIWWYLLGQMLKSINRQSAAWVQVRWPWEHAANAWTDVMLAGLR